MNLGWKLAAVVQGRAPEALLDTYHFERHPVGSDLLKHTLAQTALIATFSPEGLALRDMLAELVNHTPALSERLATTLSGLGVAYPSPDPFAHPLTGQRAPDLRVGERGLFSLLSDARAVLLDFSGALNTAAEHAAALGMTTHTAEPWPGQDDVTAALICPDGHVWWAADHASDDDVIGALSDLDVHFNRA
jgi:hypothetical protein